MPSSSVNVNEVPARTISQHEMDVTVKLLPTQPTMHLVSLVDNRSRSARESLSATGCCFTKSWRIKKPKNRPLEVAWRRGGGISQRYPTASLYCRWIQVPYNLIQLACLFNMERYDGTDFDLRYWNSCDCCSRNCAWVRRADIKVVPHRSGDHNRKPPTTVGTPIAVATIANKTPATLKAPRPDSVLRSSSLRTA